MQPSTVTIAAMYGITDESTIRWIEWRNEIDRQIEAEYESFVQDVIAPWANRAVDALDAEAK